MPYRTSPLAARRARIPAHIFTRLSLCRHPDCARGSRRLALALSRRLEAAGVVAELVNAPTLCSGTCAGGPYVGLRELDMFYAGMTREDAAEIVGETVLAGRLIFPRLRLAPYTVTDGRLVWEPDDGVMVLMEPDMCLVGAAAYLLDFHGRESCGKCAPCRLGVQTLWRILDRLERGGATDDDLTRLGAVARAMTGGSYCEFGPKAAAPALLLAQWGGAVLAAHLGQGCPQAGGPRLAPPGEEAP